MRRGLTVLKMRGSMHEKYIREFTINGTGIHIGRLFENVTGILPASPVPLQLDAAAGHPAEGPHDRSGFGPNSSSPMPAGDGGGSPASALGG